MPQETAWCRNASHVQMVPTVRELEISNPQDLVMQVTIVHPANIVGLLSAVMEGTIVQLDHQTKYYAPLGNGKI